jgi:hypothetical protein
MCRRILSGQNLAYLVCDGLKLVDLFTCP